jgi:hypothetical protein
MPYTDGRWSAGTPGSDMQIFFGASQWKDFAVLATFPAAPAAGLIYQTVPSGDACKFFLDLGLLLRSGEYATPAGSQEQFGTAAALPGPTTVANTGSPLGLLPGYPPILAANMATVGGTIGGAGIQRGPVAKGIQINSIDVIYQVLTVAAAAATVGLTKTAFANLVAPVVTNLIALGANGLPTAIGAQPQDTSVVVASPAMIIPSTDTEVILNVNLTAGAGGTINFYGVAVNCSFNFE